MGHLVWPMGSPRIQQLLSLYGWVSQLAFSIHRNPWEVGSNASEKNELTNESKGRQAKRASFFFHVLYIGCQEEVWPRLKVDLPTSKDLTLKVDFPTSTDLSKKKTKSLPGVPSHLGFILLWTLFIKNFARVWYFNIKDNLVEKSLPNHRV